MNQCGFNTHLKTQNESLPNLVSISFSILRNSARRLNLAASASAPIMESMMQLLTPSLRMHSTVHSQSATEDLVISGTRMTYSASLKAAHSESGLEKSHCYK